MKELILAGFNTFAGNATASTVSANLKAYDISVKVIPLSDYNLPVGALLSDKSFLSENYLTERIEELAESAKNKGPYTGPELECRFIVLCNLERNEIDKVLNILSESGITRDDIKAVLTPINSCFSLLQLAEELVKEHEAMNR